jgi:hypothetical protein
LPERQAEGGQEHRHRAHRDDRVDELLWETLPFVDLYGHVRTRESRLFF